MREYPHNKVQNRQRLGEKEFEVLLSCFQEERHRTFVTLYYGNGYTLETCAELMFFSLKTIERTKSIVDRVAIYSLLNTVVNSEDALKISKIKNIINGGHTNE